MQLPAVPPLSKTSLPFLRWLIVISDNLRARRGWQRIYISILLGALTALCYAPINIFPIFWISFPCLIFLLQGTTKLRDAFLVGWSFAFGSFVCGLYWIADSMFVDIGHFWWAVPFAVAGLPAFFALYYGAGMMIAQRIGLKGIAGVITFALLWFLADYVRGHLFRGFPWNLEGYGWGRVLPLLETTSFLGIYGLTFLTLVVASLPAGLIENTKRSRSVFLSSLLILILLAAWGEGRLIAAPHDFVSHVRLRLIQPDTDQAHKWLASERQANFKNLLNLTAAPGLKPVTHVIWPETAATYYLAEDDEHRRELADYTPRDGVVITGVIRRSADIDGHLHYYNSLIAVDDHARVVAGYDKVHLVPFGEYFPFRDILPLPALVNMGVDFSEGDGPRSLRVQNLPPFSPLICYEAVFPGDVIAEDDRPDFIVNITNDGWYGRTAGPYQHFASVKVRAIEEGLPLVRAANTGISGVVDAYGRVTARLGVSRVGFLDADLPEAIPPTLFSRFGELPLWIMFALMTAIVALERVSAIKGIKKRRSSK